MEVIQTAEKGVYTALPPFPGGIPAPIPYLPQNMPENANDAWAMPSPNQPRTMLPVFLGASFSTDLKRLTLKSTHTHTTNGKRMEKRNRLKMQKGSSGHTSPTWKWKPEAPAQSVMRKDVADANNLCKNHGFEN